jgi:hypothetical protein
MQRRKEEQPENDSGALSIEFKVLALDSDKVVPQCLPRPPLAEIDQPPQKRSWDAT